MARNPVESPESGRIRPQLRGQRRCIAIRVSVLRDAVRPPNNGAKDP